MNIGDNTINRRSEDAGVCTWFQHECAYFKTATLNPRPENLPVFGWPKNLLVPKGNVDGFPCKLFVMISNDEVT